MFNPYQQYSPYLQPTFMSGAQQSLLGEVVGDYETVRAAQIDMSGRPHYYPLADDSLIYRKQLLPNGRSAITRYKLDTEVEPVKPEGSVHESSALLQLNAKIDTLIAEVSKINDMWNGGDNE